MAKRSTKTATQKAYEREYNRVRRLLRENEQRGYLTEPLLPNRVKRPTKRSIARLEKINREYILDRAKAIDLETGEVISARERATRDRQRAAQKAAETRRQRQEQQIVSRETSKPPTPPTQPLPPLPSYSDIVVGNFKAEMARMPGGNSGKIIGFINGLIEDKGIDEVAVMLERANNAGKMPSYGFLASGQEDLVMEALGELLEFMPSMPQEDKEEIIDEWEAYEGGF